MKNLLINPFASNLDGVDRVLQHLNNQLQPSVIQFMVLIAPGSTATILVVQMGPQGILRTLLLVIFLNSGIAVWDSLAHIGIGAVLANASWSGG